MHSGGTRKRKKDHISTTVDAQHDHLAQTVPTVWAGKKSAPGDK